MWDGNPDTMGFSFEIGESSAHQQDGSLSTVPEKTKCIKHDQDIVDAWQEVQKKA